MKEKSLLFQWIVPGIVLAILVSLIAFTLPKDNKILAGFIGEGYRQTSTSLTTTVGMNGQTPTAYASSTIILAANDNRRYARCSNVSTTGQPLSLMLGSSATSSTLLSGLFLYPTASTTASTIMPSYIELDNDNPFTGAVYAYAQATGTALCLEN